MVANENNEWTVLIRYDEEKRMVRADFTDPQGFVEGRRWYPNGLKGEDVVWLDVANWTANNGIACSGVEGTINDGVCDFKKAFGEAGGA